MNRKLARLVAVTNLAALLLLAGCSGAGTPSTTPAGMQSAPGSTTAALSTGDARVRVTIKVPPKHRHQGSRYISPSTQSLNIAITRSGKTAFTKHLNLTPKSKGCAASLAGTVCTFTFSVKAGNGYMASLTAYDGLNGTGNVLSKGQSLLFNFKQGKLNTIPVTMDGVPLSIDVKSLGNNSILVTALDADGNFIVGPGAPTFTAGLTAGQPVAAITQPTSAAPNKISFAVSASPPVSPANETIGVTASYPTGADACTEPGAVCTVADVATASLRPVFFAGDYSNGAVKGFSVPFTSMGQAPTLTLSMPSPYAMTFDSSGDVFAVDYSGGNLYEFMPPYTAPPIESPSIATDTYAAAVNSLGDVFMTGTDVYEEAPPYNGAATTISSGIGDAYGLAFDSSNNLYVANYTSDTLGVYLAGAYTTEKYTVSLSSGGTSAQVVGSNLYVGEYTDVEIFTLPITSSAATPTVKISNGIHDVYSTTLDASGNLWASNYSSSTVTEYKAPLTTGEVPSVTISSGLDSPCSGISFDGAGNLYVLNYTGGNVVEYSPPFSNASTPSGTSSGMGDSCYGGLYSAGGGIFSLSVP